MCIWFSIFFILYKHMICFHWTICSQHQSLFGHSRITTFLTRMPNMGFLKGFVSFVLKEKLQPPFMDSENCVFLWESAKLSMLPWPCPQAESFKCHTFLNILWYFVGSGDHNTLGKSTGSWDNKFIHPSANTSRKTEATVVANSFVLVPVDSFKNTIKNKSSPNNESNKVLAALTVLLLLAMSQKVLPPAETLLRENNVLCMIARKMQRHSTVSGLKCNTSVAQIRFFYASPISSYGYSLLPNGFSDIIHQPSSRFGQAKKWFRSYESVLSGLLLWNCHGLWISQPFGVTPTGSKTRWPEIYLIVRLR